MKFLLRVLGTWFLGLAVVLVVIDGTKSLAASGLAYTSIIDVWTMLSAQSWLDARLWISDALDPRGVGDLARLVLSWPAAVVSLVIGLSLLAMGRVRRRRKYLETM